MRTPAEPSVIVSHLKQDDKGQYLCQRNDEHCHHVAELAKQFAASFGMGEWGYVLGQLHDKGKEKHQFQAYIRDVNGIPGHTDYTREGKAHAYVGALEAYHLYGKQAIPLFCNPIASHHRGLYDYSELEVILRQSLPQEVTQVTEKRPLSRPPFKIEGKDFHHLVRMLFSCLVDADYLDTESFMNESASKARGCHTSLSSLLPLLEQHLAHLNHLSPLSDVNPIRSEVQSCCRQMSDLPKGFYSLTVPTGGGKTLSSLLWALRHAIHHGMRRIVIAIPYTSIIVQTASILKQIFGEEAVLEHHSAFNPDTIQGEAGRHRAKLATENWDYPLIVTTNVQLFESMFSHRPSDCRKLHNMANSVLILDEVQTLPNGYLQPIVDTLKSYQKMFGLSVLFTTASQPVLSGLIEGCNPRAAFQGIDHIKEIIPKGYALHERLRRVRLEIDAEGSTYDDIAARLSRHDKVLCIVNTRSDAKEIYERLPKEGLTLHLSRMMCPRHVAQTIQTLRQALSDPSEKVIRVVATQLIEAGVDIDFPTVYRQEAGLDSILQAAGRCNREGKMESATTYVFSLSKEHPLYGSLTEANQARLSMTHVEDWFAPDTMTDYFRQLYSRKDTFDKKGIKSLLYRPAELSFEEASKEFRLIEEVGKTLFVNRDNSMALIEQLKREGISYSLMKQLSLYSVNVHESDFRKLVSCGAVEEVVKEIYVVSDKLQYDEQIGLRLDNHWMNEILLL